MRHTEYILALIRSVNAASDLCHPRLVKAHSLAGLVSLYASGRCSSLLFGAVPVRLRFLISSILIVFRSLYVRCKVSGVRGADDYFILAAMV